MNILIAHILFYETCERAFEFDCTSTHDVRSWYVSRYLKTYRPEHASTYAPH